MSKNLESEDFVILYENFHGDMQYLISTYKNEWTPNIEKASLFDWSEALELSLSIIRWKTEIIRPLKYEDAQVLDVMKS